MKANQVREMWAAYAVRCFKASGNNVAATVQAMNLNNKHRAQFQVVGSCIMFKGQLVVDTSTIE